MTAGALIDSRRFEDTGCQTAEQRRLFIGAPPERKGSGRELARRLQYGVSCPAGRGRR